MSYIITDKSITIFRDKPYTADRSRIDPVRWQSIIEALHDGKIDTAVELLDVSTQVKAYYHGSKIEVRDGELRYEGEVLDTDSARRVIEFMQQGLPYEPLIHFIERLQNNPSYRAVQQLYAFLEAGALPLTGDGYFLAYKKVYRDEQGKLWDIFSKRIPNDLGCRVSMPRNRVDEDPERTCSVGLHVCSFAYLPYYGVMSTAAVIVVRVDPADVVAVPSDYNNAKMRVCAYTVVEQLEDMTPRWSGEAIDTRYDEDEEEYCGDCGEPEDECHCD